MSPVRTVLRLALAIAAAGGAGAQEPWSFGVEGYVYLVEGDDDYLMPIVTADRGGLHLEARYQYEDLDTSSEIEDMGGGNVLCAMIAAPPGSTDVIAASDSPANVPGGADNAVAIGLDGLILCRWKIRWTVSVTSWESMI